MTTTDLPTTRRRSIAFLDDRYHEVYGAQENVLLLASAAIARGDDVHFLTTSDGRLADEARARGIPTIVVQAPEPLLRFERETLVGGPKQLLRLARDIWRYSAALDRTLRDLGAQVVMPSAVRPATFLVRSRLARRSRRVRIMLFAQNSTPFGVPASLAALISWRICLIGRGAITTFPAPVRKLVAKRLRALPSGRDLDRFTVADRPAPAEGTEINVLTMSSITVRKRIDLAIRAVAAVANEGIPIKLTVVGGSTGPKSDAHWDDLRKLVADLGANVEFVGWQDDPVPWFHAADLFVLASENEGLPGVLLEAMATGLPCVTTSAGSSGELVEECGGGSVVPIGDLDAIIRDVRRWATDHDARRRAGTTAAARIRERYTTEAFVQRFEAIVAEAR